MSLNIPPRVVRSIITDVLPSNPRRDTIYWVKGTPYVGGRALNSEITPGRRLGSAVKVGALATGSTSFSGYTWGLSICIPSVASAVRIAFQNFPGTASYTIDACVAGAAGVFDRTYGSGVSLRNVPFKNGKSYSLTVPAYGSARTGSPSPIGNGDVFWSDWTPLSPLAVSGVTGVTGSNLVFRVYSSSAAIVYHNNNVADAYAATLPFPYRTDFKSGDFVTTNQAGFTSFGSSPSACPIYAIEYIDAAGKTITISNYCDSIDAGYLATGTPTIGYGPQEYAASIVSANLGIPVSTVMGSYQGLRTDFYLSHFNSLITSGAGLPDIALFRPYSRNTGNNTSAIEEMISAANTFLAICSDNKITPVLVGGIYESATPGNNAVRTTVDAAVAAIAAQYGITFINNSGVITAANSGTLLDADGIHPLSAGTSAMGTNYAASLSPLVKTLIT